MPGFGYESVCVDLAPGSELFITLFSSTVAKCLVLLLRLDNGLFQQLMKRPL